MHEELTPLAAELEDAEETLKFALEQACSRNPSRADTGELIRLDEMLAIASDAAKKAISIRRKRRYRRQVTDAVVGGEGDGPDSDGATAPEPPGHRVFTDEQGVVWSVWSVQPDQREDDRHSRLRGSYSKGWLAFESTIGKRRLSPIPSGWADLDDAELQRLCEHAEPARQIPRGRPLA